MTQDKPPIKFEDIETTPAAELLKLRYTAINDLIREAQRRVNQAQTIIDWLEGIKLEKSFRQVAKRSQQEGGHHD